MDAKAKRQRFKELHESGTFVIPNPWDVGSARVLEVMGFSALATTSSGFAASVGLPDQHVTLEQLVPHVAAICEAVDIPLNVDAERCYADDTAGVTRTIELLAEAGAAGISIEDYNPATGALDSLDDSIARVTAAAYACERHGITLTGRCENHLYGFADLDDTIERLRAYKAAGARVAYAPGLMALDDIAKVVEAVPGPHNILALRKGPSVSELASVGVRRVSTGGSLAWAAYGGLAAAAKELLDEGTSTYLDHVVPRDIRSQAFRA